ncbi:MAG: DUF1801 domain-containing protein [Spirochaetota bacterium]
MNVSRVDAVNDFLADIGLMSKQQLELVLVIRTLFFKASKNIEEGIKYGGLLFTRQGRMLGGIFIYKKHMSIEFSDGATFTDADAILEGKGKFRRHIKIHSQDDLVQKKVSYYIAQAV